MERAYRYRKRYGRRNPPGVYLGTQPWRVEGEYTAINNLQEYDVNRPYKRDMRPARYGGGPLRWKHGNPYIPPPREAGERYEQWLNWRKIERQQYAEEMQVRRARERNQELDDFRNRFDREETE